MIPWEQAKELSPFAPRIEPPLFCGTQGDNTPLVLKEGGGDSTRTLFFSPRGVLKQGGKVSTASNIVEFI